MIHKSSLYSDTHNKYNHDKVFKREVTKIEILHHIDIIQQDILQEPKNSSKSSITTETIQTESKKGGKFEKTPQNEGGGETIG
jgi:hypothetical protein